MRKLFKKSLACCLALALCLTLFAGAITVNAELTTTPTYSTEEVSVVQGESTTIKFKLNDFSEIQGVILKVFVPEAVVSIDEVTAEGVTLEEWDDDEGSGNYEIDKDGKFVKFMSLANITEDDTVTAITFNIKVTVDAEAEAKSYDYPAPVIQATDGNELITIAGEFAEFEVTEKVVEPPVAEPTLDPNLVLGRQMYMGEVFGLYYALPQDVYAKGGYDNYYIEVVAQKYDAEYNVYTAEPVIITKDQISHTQDGADYYLYANTAGYEMLLEFTATVYCEKDGVITYCAPKTHTIAERALNGIQKEIAKGDTDLLSLYVNVVNYGAQVEDYFAAKFPNSQLAASSARANDAFDAYQKYDIQESITPVDGNTTTYPYAGSSTETARIGRQAQVKASNVLGYDPVEGSHDPAKLYLEVSYTDSYGNLKADSVRLTETERFDNGWFTFEKIALYDVNQPVYANLYEDGNEIALVSNIYSMETAAARNTEAAANDLFAAVLKLGYAARAYFNFD